MNEEFSKMLSELIGYPVDMDFKQSFEKNGINNDIVIATIQCRRFDRIAEALEGINNNLSEIVLSLDGLDKNLDGCISRTERGNLLCITGDITTY